MHFAAVEPAVAEDDDDHAPPGHHPGSSGTRTAAMSPPGEFCRSRSSSASTYATATKDGDEQKAKGGEAAS